MIMFTSLLSNLATDRQFGQGKSLKTQASASSAGTTLLAPQMLSKLDGRAWRWL